MEKVVVSFSAPPHVACTRAAIAALVAATLYLTGCTGLLPHDSSTTNATHADTAEINAPADGIVLKLAGATVTLPKGAVPEGTLVKAAKEEAPANPLGVGGGGAGFLKSASDAVHVNIGTPLAEGTSMTLAVKLDAKKFTDGFVPGAESLALVHRNGQALEEKLVPVEWNQQTGEAIATISDFLSDGRYYVVQADVPQVLDATALAIQKSADMAGQRPSCTDNPVTANGVKITAQPTVGVWVCLREAGGLATASISGQQMVPRRATIADVDRLPVVLDKNILDPYFDSLLEPLLASDQGMALAMPGTAVEIKLGAPGSEKRDWEFQLYPAMFLLNYLATMVDAVHAVDRDADASQGAACIAPALQANQNAVDLDETWAVPFVEDFMGCFSQALETDATLKVVLGAIGADPVLVAHSVGALWKAQQNRYSTTVSVVSELQWTTFAGTVNDAKVSFDHPVLWKAVDGSADEQDGVSRAVDVYNQAGIRMAQLFVADNFSADKPKEVATAMNLGTIPADFPHSGSTSLEVHALAIDSADIIPHRTTSPWPTNVLLDVSLGAHRSNEDLVDHDIETLRSIVAVDTGIKLKYSDDAQGTKRYLSFGQDLYFDSVGQAKDYLLTTEFARLQKMLASFRG